MKETTEKKLLRALCGVFSAVTVISVCFSAASMQKTKRMQKVMQISAAELLYECVTEASDVLLRLNTGENMTSEQAVQLLRSSVGGKFGLSILASDTASTAQLMRFFSELEEAVDGDTNIAYLTEYANELRYAFVQARQHHASLPEQIPKYLDQTATEPPPFVPEQSFYALSEKEARELARKALGGNIRLESAAVIDEHGYTYLLKNAYVRIGISGRVTSMFRELSDADAEETKITATEARSAALKMLTAVGYDTASLTEIEVNVDQGQIWRIRYQYRDVALTVGISTVSGVLCELISIPTNMGN